MPTPPDESDELTLDAPMAEDEEEGEELLLDSVDMRAEDIEDQGEAPVAATRSWLTREELPAEPEAKTGGTLFERMSNIARGAAKAQVEESEEDDGPRLRTGTTRDPLDIPRFLNRQNNQ